LTPEIIPGSGLKS